ncbi:glycosyltransferase family 2 protein [Variovorax boronicumulans]|uniref:glycosyltransferase family 2 protein n=1 Tax=Variovorax boronicumulans TaxID=436515 RepID=UPI003399CA77
MSGDESPSTNSRNKITVLIPTFNRRVQLQQAVESVLQERRVPVEVHIFDNASTDQTEAYVRNLVANDSRVIYLRRPENIGSTANYQHALGTVSTAYFVPLADDDWLLPGFLHDAYQILEGHREVGAAVFVTEARDEAGSFIETYPAPLEKLHFGLLHPREHLTDWMRYLHYGWSSVLWRKETLACVGAPYLRTGLPSDVDFQLQIFCQYPVYLCNRPGAVYSVHSNQASRDFNVSHIHSWALLFQRLDREIDRRKIFTLEEYLPLRKCIEERYRGAWRAPAETELSTRARLSAAMAAGFRLGDWDTAFSLLEGVPSESAPGASNVFRLPSTGRELEARLAGTADSADDLLGLTIAWMKLARKNAELLEDEIAEATQARRDTHAELSGEVLRLSREHDELVTELLACRTRESSAFAKFEVAEKGRLESAKKFQELSSRPLVRIARKLGLLQLTK